MSSPFQKQFSAKSPLAKANPSGPEIGQEEIKEIKQETGVEFTTEGANQLFTKNRGETDIPGAELGKYKNTGILERGSSVDNKPSYTFRKGTSKGQQANADKYLKKLNKGNVRTTYTSV